MPPPCFGRHALSRRKLLFTSLSLTRFSHVIRSGGFVAAACILIPLKAWLRNSLSRHARALFRPSWPRLRADAPVLPAPFFHISGFSLRVFAHPLLAAAALAPHWHDAAPFYPAAA